MRALIATLLLCAGSAHAITGNDLHALMQNEQNTTDKAAALFYVAGLTDGVAFGQFAAGQPAKGAGDKSICLPAGVQVSQAYDVIKAYLVANPARRNLDAGPLSTFALWRAWPCSKPITN